MVEYVKKSWQIFLANMNEIAGAKYALALVFLFAAFFGILKDIERIRQPKRKVNYFLGIQSEISPKPYNVSN